ncbi:MAG: cupin domain-containing protein [Cocleimonas sp.]|nr:cupin domain-containing protein [Cocleimonas sp.]
MTTAANEKLLGGLDYQTFLNEYWQQKPLLIRQAFSGSPLAISPEALAGIACDTDAPSRLVIEQGETPWESLFGPFDDNTFAQLPDSHWTLLVNDLECYIPEAADIIQHFRFIPDWRIDDLMLSYAVKHGSVGPHTDEYDVFLIQTSGKRHWKIDTNEHYLSELLPDCSLSILKHFETSHDWVLEAGDMLYLPPNLPHYGIAKDDQCMTLSVGFRAPSQQELISAWLESASNNPKFKQRYSDKKRSLQQQAAEITKNDIAALSKMILEGIDHEKEHLSLWLGKYLTEAKGDPIDDQNIFNETSPHDEVFIRQHWLRLAYFENNNTLDFFADGIHYQLSHPEKEAIFYLCQHYRYSKSQIAHYCQGSTFNTIFNDLLEKGGIT